MISAFNTSMYYCVHCVLHPDHSQPFSSSTSVMHHVEDKHKIPVKEQRDVIDYVTGWSASKIWERRCDAAVREGTKAALAFDQPDYTLEDLLVDIGDPAKEDAP